MSDVCAYGCEYHWFEIGFDFCYTPMQALLHLFWCYSDGPHIEYIGSFYVSSSFSSPSAIEDFPFAISKWHNAYGTDWNEYRIPEWENTNGKMNKYAN